MDFDIIVNFFDDFVGDFFESINVMSCKNEFEVFGVGVCKFEGCWVVDVRRGVCDEDGFVVKVFGYLGRYFGWVVVVDEVFDECVVFNIECELNGRRMVLRDEW